MTVPQAIAFVRERLPDATCRRHLKWLSHKVCRYVYVVHPNRQDAHQVGQSQITRGLGWKEAAEELQYRETHPSDLAQVIPHSAVSSVD